MSTPEFLLRLIATPVGSPLDWKAVRDEIAEEYGQATPVDRVALLQVYHVVMGRAEQAISSDDLPTFQTARRQDYNRMLVSECIVNDGDVSRELLKAVTDREVAAGRMAPDDDLRQIAVTGIPRH